MRHHFNRFLAIILIKGFLMKLLRHESSGLFNSLYLGMDCGCIMDVFFSFQSIVLLSVKVNIITNRQKHSDGPEQEQKQNKSKSN